MTPYYKGERLNLDCNQFAPKAHCATSLCVSVGQALSPANSGLVSIYFTATVTVSLPKPATVTTSGTASPGVMPLGT
jgi:hypothetical protein